MPKHRSTPRTGSSRVSRSLLVLGNVDTGRSTAVGYLLNHCGYGNKVTLDAFSESPAELSRLSCPYAWVLDRLKADREMGTATDATVPCQFCSPKSVFTIIDAPGHRDFIKNMITGTSQADAAILMIDSTQGGFEAGISKDGQTREHALLLAFTLGVRQLIVCCNKMDDKTVQFSQDRYNEISKEVGAYLKKIGYNVEKVRFIPISGWQGDNMIEKSDNMTWYKGPTLLEVLDTLEAPVHLMDRPLRVSLQDVYKINGMGTVAAGRVHTGTMKPGDPVVFALSGVTTRAVSFITTDNPSEPVFPGYVVYFELENVRPERLHRGDVCGGPARDPPRPAQSFTACLTVLHQGGSLTVGGAMEVDCHTCRTVCTLDSIESKVDRRSGKELEKSPRRIRFGDAAIVKMVPQTPMCVEAFKDYPPLGRFAVRVEGVTIAVGAITAVNRN